MTFKCFCIKNFLLQQQKNIQKIKQKTNLNEILRTGIKIYTSDLMSGSGQTIWPVSG